MSIIGGASIPRGHTRLNGSMPGFRLTADEVGVRVVAGRRSAILHARGKRPSQFSTLKRRPITALAQMVEAHGVPVERVRSPYLRRLDKS